MLTTLYLFHSTFVNGIEIVGNWQQAEYKYTVHAHISTYKVVYSVYVSGGSRICRKGVLIYCCVHKIFEATPTFRLNHAHFDHFETNYQPYPEEVGHA